MCGLAFLCFRVVRFSQTQFLRASCVLLLRRHSGFFSSHKGASVRKLSVVAFFFLERPISLHWFWTHNTTATRLTSKCVFWVPFCRACRNQNFHLVKKKVQLKNVKNFSLRSEQIRVALLSKKWTSNWDSLIHTANSLHSLLLANSQQIVYEVDCGFFQDSEMNLSGEVWSSGEGILFVHAFASSVLCFFGCFSKHEHFQFSWNPIDCICVTKQDWKWLALCPASKVKTNCELGGLHQKNVPSFTQNKKTRFLLCTLVSVSSEFQQKLNWRCRLALHGRSRLKTNCRFFSAPDKILPYEAAHKKLRTFLARFATKAGLGHFWFLSAHELLLRERQILSQWGKKYITEC